jgi:hypothetical protein
MWALQSGIGSSKRGGVWQPSRGGMPGMDSGSDVVEQLEAGWSVAAACVLWQRARGWGGRGCDDVATRRRKRCWLAECVLWLDAGCRSCIWWDGEQRGLAADGEEERGAGLCSVNAGACTQTIPPPPSPHWRQAVRGATTAVRGAGLRPVHGQSFRRRRSAAFGAAGPANRTHTAPAPRWGRRQVRISHVSCVAVARALQGAAIAVQPLRLH